MSLAALIIGRGGLVSEYGSKERETGAQSKSADGAQSEEQAQMERKARSAEQKAQSKERKHQRQSPANQRRKAQANRALKTLLSYNLERVMFALSRWLAANITQIIVQKERKT